MTLPPRAPRPTLQPRFTLGILYLMLFFFAYCLALVAPELYRVWTTVPPGPEQMEIARRAAQEAVQPRLGFALVAAVVTTGAAIWAGLLPGVRRRR